MVTVHRDVVEAKQHRPVGVRQPPPVLRVLVLELGQGPGIKPVLCTVYTCTASVLDPVGGRVLGEDAGDVLGADPRVDGRHQRALEQEPVLCTVQVYFVSPEWRKS